MEQTLENRLKLIYKKVEKMLVAERQLKTQIQGLKTQIDQFKALNKNIKEKSETQAQTIANLENEIKVLRMAQSLKSDEKQGAKELKLTINEYIKEIDQCIAMLNQS